MYGVGQNLDRLSTLHNFPLVHDRDTPAQGRNGEQIMRDKQDGYMESLIQLCEQLEHFGLGDYVEGAGRLVGDEQSGAAVEDRHRDQHSLRLPHA